MKNYLKFSKDGNETTAEKVAISIAALAVGFALKKLLETGYNELFNERPPNAVMDEKINWGKVIGWTVVSGLTISLTKVAIKRMGGKYV